MIAVNSYVCLSGFYIVKAIIYEEKHTGF